MSSTVVIWNLSLLWRGEGTGKFFSYFLSYYSTLSLQSLHLERFFGPLQISFFQLSQFTTSLQFLSLSLITLNHSVSLEKHRNLAPHSTLCYHVSHLLIYCPLVPSYFSSSRKSCSNTSLLKTQKFHSSEYRGTSDSFCFVSFTSWFPHSHIYPIPTLDLLSFPLLLPHTHLS